MDVRAAFDFAVAAYDAEEAANPIMRRMRARSLAVLRETFPPGSRLLDLGAGTGTEAIALARDGRIVVAADPSPRMLDALRAKAADAGVDVPALVASASDSADVAGIAALAPFDGAYSSFGALNMEPDLGRVAGVLHGLVRPGGRVVASVLSRWAVTEIVGYFATLRWRKMLRRATGRHRFKIRDGPWVDVRYPSYRGYRRAFRGRFVVERAEALPLLVPPPYAHAALARSPRLLRALEAADDRLAGLPGMAGFGDHFLVVMRRE